ncbi:MAG TPA: hypothetical protein VM364_04630 [Vicinamibacterales bacterium]|nr:hypothetical protein [Vicinamibacterales bacterium]
MTRLEPIRRLSEAELTAACAGLPRDVRRFVARDPYGPLPPGTRPVDFYRPHYVRGRAREMEQRCA